MFQFQIPQTRKSPKTNLKMENNSNMIIDIQFEK